MVRRNKSEKDCSAGADVLVARTNDRKLAAHYHRLLADVGVESTIKLVDKKKSFFNICVARDEYEKAYDFVNHHNSPELLQYEPQLNSRNKRNQTG